MYTSFYNLDKKPFEKNADPSFLWLGAKQEEVLATLHNGMSESKGFLLLTGETGCGKTILAKSFVQSLGRDVVWAVISDPRMERVDFYNAIAREFGINKSFTSKVQFLIQFSHFLHKADDENKKVLLWVDDCHLLSQEMLEELRLLSNIERADAKLINIFFVGQPVFNDMLSQPRNRAVEQRLTMKNELGSLDVKETGDYIRYRLKIAGKEEMLFSAKAVEAVYRFSQGIAGRINAICAHALENGAAQSIKTIDNRLIEACAQQMDIPGNFHQGDDEKISAGKVSINDPSAIFIPKPAMEDSPLSGVSLKKNNQRRRLRYGVGVLVLIVVGGYFWFQPPRSLERDQEVAVEVADVPVVKRASRVSSSPAVAMFEENKSVINGKKAIELKIAILEKAYNDNNGQTEEATKLRAEEAVAEEAVVKEVVVEATVAEETVAEETVVEEAVVEEVVAEDIAELESVSEPKVSLSPEKIKQKIVPEEPAVAAVEIMAPLEPRKIILGLRPNSLKLTNEGQKELDSFIEKLKEYPRATVYVKGFVSSKSNSPENIILSRDRAQSVQKLMLEKGIEAEQIEVVGMGNQDPIASNNTSEGRRQNRRVEVIVIDDGT